MTTSDSNQVINGSTIPIPTLTGDRPKDLKALLVEAKNLHGELLSLKARTALLQKEDATTSTKSNVVAQDQAAMDNLEQKGYDWKVRAETDMNTVRLLQDHIAIVEKRSIDEKNKLDARNEQAAERLREERRLKKQAQETQRGLSRKLEDSKQEASSLRKALKNKEGALRSKEKDQNIAEQVCKQMMEEWNNHDCPYSRSYRDKRDEDEALEAKSTENDVDNDAYQGRYSGGFRGYIGSTAEKQMAAWYLSRLGHYHLEVDSELEDEECYCDPDDTVLSCRDRTPSSEGTSISSS